MGFAAFERKMLNMPHAGWVHYKSLSNGEFTLLKSPYRSTFTDNNSYVAPADMRPNENEFVQVEVDNYIRDIKSRIKNTNYIDYKNYYRVKSITKPNLNEIAMLEKPFLNGDEFLYRVASNWKNADQDHLDFSLAIQILSCPESVYGIGGIGTKSITYVKSVKTPLIDLQKSISRILPSEFLGVGNRYQYNFIQSKKTQLAVEKGRLNSEASEICYNHLWQLPEPSPVTSIQIPTIIHNAEYIPRNLELDQDVVEYLLTALIIKPPIEDYMISKIEKTTMNVHQRIRRDEDFANLNLDPSSPSKIANAICRLNLREKMDEDVFDSYVSIFDEVTRAFLEAELDKVETNPDRRTWDVPISEVSYADKLMEQEDYFILRIMRKIEEDQGKKCIKPIEIAQHKDFNPDWIDWRLDDSLRRLTNLAKIIKCSKGLGYRRYKL